MSRYYHFLLLKKVYKWKKGIIYLYFIFLTQYNINSILFYYTITMLPVVTFNEQLNFLQNSSAIKPSVPSIIKFLLLLLLLLLLFISILFNSLLLLLLLLSFTYALPYPASVY